MDLRNAAPFPRLRTGYLRAIARAWHDPDFEKRLIEESKRGERGALDFLEQTYNFHFPFNIKFCISLMKRPRWRPEGTPGWIGFADEFEVFLPPLPEDPKIRAAVLARYCQEFPSLLGAPLQDGIQAPPDFGAFGVVTSKLLALAWHNGDFRKALYAAHDARSLVQGTMDVLVDWNFLLKFKEAPGPSSDDDDYWRDFPRSKIIVHLPERPEQRQPMPDETFDTVEPIALASYNGSGSQYPFTCI